MKKKMLYISLMAIIIAVSLINTASAATISGKIYNLYLERAEDIIVEVDTSPIQKIISKDGTYTFNVPVGNYSISAGLYLDNVLDSYASENISVTAEGDFNLDLILFPYLGEQEELFPEYDIVPDYIIGEYSVPEKTNMTRILISLFLVIIIISILIYFANKKPKERKDGTLISVTSDLQRLIEIIREEGGRTTQKNIRKKIPLSEAKISLMISELKDKGIIKKIKKGRGNIIILVGK